MKKFVFAAATGGAMVFSALPASAQVVFVDATAMSVCTIDANTCGVVVDNYLAVLNSGSLTDEEYQANLALLISYLIDNYGSAPGFAQIIAAQIDKILFKECLGMGVLCFFGRGLKLGVCCFELLLKCLYPG